MSLKILNCIVALGGSDANHSVPKDRITELELRLLRKIHGGEAISKIQSIGFINMTERAEHLNLAMRYGREMVEDTFGVELSGFEDWLADRLDQREAERAEREQFGYPDFAQLEKERKEALSAFISNAASTVEPVLQVISTEPASTDFDDEDSLENSMYDGEGNLREQTPTGEPEPQQTVETVKETATKDQTIDLE